MRNLEISMGETFITLCYARLLMLIEFKNASSYTSHLEDSYYEVKATLDTLILLRKSINNRQIKVARDRLYAGKNPINIRFKDESKISLIYEKFEDRKRRN